MTSKVYHVKSSLFHCGVFHWGDERFGDDWPARHRSRPKDAVSHAQGFRSGEAGGPGRIPAQLVAHTLFYFTKPGDLVLDPTRPPRLKAKPMAGRWQGVALCLMCALFLSENASLLILQPGTIARIAVRILNLNTGESYTGRLASGS